MRGHRFHLADYPGGCRCACCSKEFVENQTIIDREMVDDWSTPTCASCAASDAPLANGHPFALDHAPVFRPDGRVV